MISLVLPTHAESSKVSDTNFIVNELVAAHTVVPSLGMQINKYIKPQV